MKTAFGSGKDVWIKPISRCCVEEIILQPTIKMIELAVDQGDRHLPEVSYQLYRSLFSLISSGYGLLRIWNYIPRILEVEEGEERYRLYNIGRYEAWQDAGPKVNQNRVVPAATGVGVFGGPIMLKVLFTPYPVVHLQNPRQTPAAGYSSKYGKLPPMFARATYHETPDSHEIYISGTAAIIGEDIVSESLGNAALQAQMTLANIETLVSQVGFHLPDITTLRVYIRRHEDYQTIKQIVECTLDETVEPLYLRTEICRPELLVEIEGIASKSA